MASIHLNLTLIKYVNKKEYKVIIEEAAHIYDVLKEAGIPPEEVGMAIKNGKWASLDDKITDNDIIELFPPLSGG